MIPEPLETSTDDQVIEAIQERAGEDHLGLVVLEASVGGVIEP